MARIYRLTTGSQGQNASRGLFNFTGGISGNAAADFLLGEPLNITSAGIGGLVQARQWRDAFFLSDKWSASKNLTLTIGLRYELPTVAQSPNGSIHVLSPDGATLIPTQVPLRFRSPTPSATPSPRGLVLLIARVINGGTRRLRSLLQRQSDERVHDRRSIRLPIA